MIWNLSKIFLYVDTNADAFQVWRDQSIILIGIHNCDKKILRTWLNKQVSAILKIDKSRVWKDKFSPNTNFLNKKTKV